MLYASNVYSESKKPIDILRIVPSSSWCSETRRFLESVVNDRIALSGMRFFFLKRKLILKVNHTQLVSQNPNEINTYSSFQVAATIVTYELIVIQNRYHTD